ncbi:MAG: hypothetical protein ACKV0T_07775, partial [Planctomycetales bacterium]
MRLLLDPIWAWPWVVLAAAGALATVVGTYRRRIAHLPGRSRRMLLGLRLAAWALMVFTFIRPGLEVTHTDPHASVYMVLADRSRSTGVRDASTGATRREALVRLLADVAPDLAVLGRDVEIRQFDFDKELVPVEERLPAAEGEQTAIGHILDEATRAAQGKRIAGILLIGDGAHRALPPFDADPRSAAGRLADQQTRVDTVVIGSTGMSDATLDLAAEDLEVSPTVFVKNVVTVAAKVRAQGAAGRDVVVRVLVEDPISALPGQPPEMKVVDTPRTLRPARNQEL